MSGTKLGTTWVGAFALLLSSASAAPLLNGCGPSEETPLDEGKQDLAGDKTPTKRDAGTSSSRRDASTGATPAKGSDTPGDEQAGDAGKAPDSKGNPPTGGTGEGWCKVKTVLEARCISCHDGKGTAGTPDGINFAKYEDLQLDSPDVDGAKMFERIAVRIHPDTSKLPPMPPRGPLMASQTVDIDAWVAAGAPNAAETCAPTEPATPGIGADGRPISIWDESLCDAIYKITVPALAVPASPEETYKQVDIDAPWGTETVQVINQRPITDNGPVLHHWILYDKAGPFLTGWAPGDEERTPLPEDVGMKMPSGKASMYMDMHYYNRSGKAQQDSSGVELCVVKGKNLRANPAGITMGFSQLSINIPPGATAHSVKGTCTVRASKPITLMTASPHAHRLARKTVFTLQKKNGTKITMLDEPFTFGEQATFPLTDKLVVENGDKVITECIFGNDTNQAVRFGESNDTEMCFNFAAYYPVGAFCCEELGLESCLLGGGSAGVGSGGLSGFNPSSLGVP